ncbi:hypothetical protein IU449_26670 [Nocardia higoensis]|uniref:Uncharacterized protein n=1 Tax=Nocardia higoensis TaxID=228599 RepID=A0ABS0DJI8_9NOCA|nr:hypothetical protein [Nocardia higoensis]MBF6358083.1 hypothetical protein [Nocardia higoensis]
MLDHAQVDATRLHTDLTRLGIITMHAPNPDQPVTYTAPEGSQVWKMIGRITVSAYTMLIGVWPCSGPHFRADDADRLAAEAVDTWLNLTRRDGRWSMRPNGLYGPEWGRDIIIPIVTTCTDTTQVA